MSATTNFYDNETTQKEARVKPLIPNIRLYSNSEKITLNILNSEMEK